MTAIDKIFRFYGIDFFGDQVMDKITPEQIEECRVEAFKELDKLTKKYGLQPKGTVKELFCNILFERYI